MKRITLITFILALGFTSHGQLAIKFDKLVHDFGRVDRSKGDVTAIFNFTNTGNTPLRVLSVRPSCGCTTSDFTKDTIFVGQSGFVNAVFDPNKSMMGDFSKLVELNTNLGTYKLTIQGNVFNSQEVERPSQQIVFDKSYVQLGEVEFGSSFKDTITVTNHTDAEQNLRQMTSSTGNVKVTFNKNKIPPHGFAEIYVDIEFSDPRFLGETQTGFTILTTDHFNPMMSFTYEHYLKQKFPKLTKKYLKTAPKIGLDKKEVDYGYVKAGTIHQSTFTITNEGKDTLTIWKANSACSCLSFELSRNEIPPGESATLLTTFDTVLRKNGENTKYITLITNDPKQSEIGLKHFYILIP